MIEIICYMANKVNETIGSPGKEDSFSAYRNISPCDNKSASHWIMLDYFFHVWKVNIFPF